MIRDLTVVGLIKKNNLQVKNFSLYLFASLLSSLLNLAFNPFLANNLSSLDYSIIGYYTSFTSLFTPILNFSLISYYVRKYFQIPEEKRQTVCDTIIVALIVWGVISTISILLVFGYYCHIKNVELPFLPYALLCVAQMFFNNFLLLYQVNNRMQRNARKYFIVTIVNAVSAILLSIVFVIIFKLGATGRLTALLVSSFAVGVFCISKTLKSFRCDFSVLKDAVSFGWPVSCTYIIQYFLIGIDIALIESLGDVETMGLYVVGATIGNYLTVFYTALSQTFEPDIYEAVARKSYKKILKIVCLIVVILILIIVGFALLAKPITYVLTYNKYTAAYVFARIIAISVLTSYLMTAGETVLNAFGYTKTCLVCKILSAFCAVVIYHYLINEFAFFGAAWGRVMAPFSVFIFDAIAISIIMSKALKK